MCRGRIPSAHSFSSQTPPQVERWDRVLSAHPELRAERRRAEAAWRAANMPQCMAALTTMRTFVFVPTSPDGPTPDGPSPTGPTPDGPTPDGDRIDGPDGGPEVHLNGSSVAPDGPAAAPVGPVGSGLPPALARRLANPVFKLLVTHPDDIARMHIADLQSKVPS